VRLVAFVITNAIIRVFYVQSSKKVTCFLLSVTVEVHLDNNFAHTRLVGKKKQENKTAFNFDRQRYNKTNVDCVTTERPTRAYAHLLAEVYFGDVAPTCCRQARISFAAGRQ